MTNTALLFACSFAVVFALGLQQQNVHGQHRTAAFVTSLFIGAASLVQFKLLPGPTTAAEIAAYLLGSALGILASIEAHPRLARLLSKRALVPPAPMKGAGEQRDAPPATSIAYGEGCKRMSEAHWRRYEALRRLADDLSMADNSLGQMATPEIRARARRALRTTINHGA